MSGIRGWRDGSRYRMAAASGTLGSSQDYLWDGNNKRKETENPRSQQHLKRNKVAEHLATNNSKSSIAEKELDDWERWKEEHRQRPINLAPQRLVKTCKSAIMSCKNLFSRWKEIRSSSKAKPANDAHAIQILAKAQEKRTYKSKKEDEGTEILKKKALQREKAERLEVKKRQQEMQREMFLEDQYYKTNEFLSRLDLSLPKSDSCQIANHGSESTAWIRSHTCKQALREDETRRLEEMKQEQQRKAELMEFKHKQEEEDRMRAHQDEQRRVNNAFLDRLQNKTQPTSIHQPEHSASLD